MSERWQEETHAPQQLQALFDHLVGAGNDLRRHRKAVARQKGRDRDCRAALIWINPLETFLTKVFWKCTARRIHFVEVFGDQYAPTPS
jgi:hypothetical protein